VIARMNDPANGLIGNDQVSPLTSLIYELILQAAEVLPSLQTEDGSRHFKYGIMRRLFMIRLNVCEILRLVDRPTSYVLQGEDSLILGMNLNSLYVHLHGILDNMAWCIAYESRLFSQLSENDTRSRRNVGLFHTVFLNALKDNPAAIFLKSKLSWHSEMKRLRDPIAHRVPLYAVPGIMTSDEATRFKEMSDASIAALKIGDLAEHQRLMVEAGKIGAYHPVFCNDTGGGLEVRRIRPQIDDDVKNVLEILKYFLAKGNDWSGTGLSSLHPHESR
jgi:hypothetical protein